MLVFNSDFECFGVLGHAVYNTSIKYQAQGKAALPALSIPTLEVRGLSRKIDNNIVYTLQALSGMWLRPYRAANK